MVVDESHVIVFANEAAKARFGTENELEGTRCHEVTHPDLGLLPNCPLEEATVTGEAAERKVFDAPSRHWYRCGIYPSTGKSGDRRLYVLTFEDITQQVESQQELERLNKALRTISASNQALLRSDDEQALMEEVCRTAVDIGGFRLAWVGQKDHNPGKTITPIAWAGHNDGFLENNTSSWGEERRAWDSTGQAVRTAHPVFTPNLQSRTVEPWREAVRRGGYGSSASFPLVVEGDVFGVFSLHASETEAFAEGEAKILEELAADLAFGISTLRTRAMRHEAEEAVRRSEERYRFLADNIQDPIFGLDLEGRHVAVNRAAHEVVGMSAEEMLGKTMDELGLPEHIVDEWANAHRQVIETAEQVRVETVIPAPSGDARTFEVTLSPVFDPEGRVQNVRGISRDVTAQRQAEVRLKESERRHRRLVEGSPNGIVIVDMKSTIRYANPAAPLLLGTASAEDLIGRSWREFVASDSLAKARRFATLAETGEFVPSMEGEVARADGARSWVEVSGVPFELEGEPAVYVVFSDISDRKEVQNRLRRSEEKHRRLIEHSPFGVVIVNERGRIRYVNPASAQLLGASTPDDLIGRSMTEFIRPDFAKEAWRLLSLVESGTPTPAREMELVREDGNIGPVETSAIPLEFEGEPAAYVVIRDITEHKKAEAELKESQEQLHQSQKLESIGQLAGGVAHDFNNLLTVITGDLQLVLSEEDGAPLGQIRSYLDEIQAAAERAGDLTGQLLAFSRKQPYRPRVVILNDAVAHMDALLRRTMGEDTSIQTILGENLWPVEIDPVRLEQIMLNLAINARDAMGYGGNLTIETQNVVLDETYMSTHLGSTPGDHVMLAVSDDGEGMDAETAAAIFDPFFTTKGEGKGTGLGLSTVYGIVKQLGGNIWVYSEPGEGTTFKIYLPRSHKQVDWYPPEDSQIDTSSARGTETILLVEDEETVRRLAERILAREGYTVLTAASGAEAIQEAETHPGSVDLLLTDVVLPQMIGLDVAEALQKKHPSIKVLYMSGYTKNAIVHEGRLDEGVRLLEKPFRPDELARAVRNAMDAR